jgi:hypothetical protein
LTSALGGRPLGIEAVTITVSRGRGVDGLSEFTLTGMEEISVSMCWREHEDSERRDSLAFPYAILGESLAGNTYLIRIAHDP